jgi:segregation and condensation protein A
VRVQLQAFDGPLDLLLHLIQRDEIDIYDIPIARITAQYLEHLTLMEELDLEVAGEYLVMAATLIRIKSQMLLPRPALDAEGEEIDPRDELVRRLIEYRKFKEIAEHLRGKEEDRRLRHARPVSLPDLAPEDIPLGQVSVFDLLTYLKDILERTEEEFLHTVQIEPITLEERMEILRARLAERPRIRFSDFLHDVRTRIGIVVSFMALLEVMKAGEAIALQDDPFTEIFIARREQGGAEPDAGDRRGSPLQL